MRITVFAAAAAAAAGASGAGCPALGKAGVWVGPLTLNITTNATKYAAVSGLRCTADSFTLGSSTTASGAVAIAAEAVFRCAGTADINIDDMVPTYGNCLELTLRAAPSVELAPADDALELESCRMPVSDVDIKCESEWDPPLCPLMETVLRPENRDYGYNDALAWAEKTFCDLAAAAAEALPAAAAAALAALGPRRVADPPFEGQCGVDPAEGAGTLQFASAAFYRALPAGDIALQPQALALGAADSTVLHGALRRDEDCCCCAPEDWPRPRISLGDLVGISARLAEAKVLNLDPEVRELRPGADGCSATAVASLGEAARLALTVEVVLAPGRLTNGVSERSAAVSAVLLLRGATVEADFAAPWTDQAAVAVAAALAGGTYIGAEHAAASRAAGVGAVRLSADKLEVESFDAGDAGGALAADPAQALLRAAREPLLGQLREAAPQWLSLQLRERMQSTLAAELAQVLSE